MSPAPGDPYMNTLDYARPINPPPPALWPAMVVAFLACPIASAVAGVIGGQMGSGSDLLSTRNFLDAVMMGIIVGGLGGVFTAGIAAIYRRKSLPISITGSILVTTFSGGLVFLAFSISSSC